MRLRKHVFGSEKPLSAISMSKLYTYNQELLYRTCRSSRSDWADVADGPLWVGVISARLLPATTLLRHKLNGIYLPMFLPYRKV